MLELTKGKERVSAIASYSYDLGFADLIKKKDMAVDTGDFIKFKNSSCQTEVSFAFGRYSNFLKSQVELNLIFSKIKFGKDLITVVKDNDEISYVRDKKMTQLLQKSLPFLSKMDAEKTFSAENELVMEDGNFLELKAIEILLNYCFEAHKYIRLKEEKDKLKHENTFLNNSCLRFKKALQTLDNKYSE